MIHEKLSSSSDQSLLDQNLDGMENTEQCSSLSILFDSLSRPGADSGEENVSSCLRWVHDSNRTLPHLLISESEIGGAWNDYDDETMTLSVHQLLDLPGVSVSECFKDERPDIVDRRCRLAIRDFRRYMNIYCDRVGICSNIATRCRVDHIEHKEDGLWHLRGHRMNEGDDDEKSFELLCRRLVMATGLGKARELGIDGEQLVMKNRVHDVTMLRRCNEKRIGPVLDNRTGDDQRDEKRIGPVLVIGDGVTAADVLLFCLEHDRPVIHVIRRSDKQLRGILLARLSNRLHPEYSRVYNLMLGREEHALYRRLLSTRIECFIDAHTASLQPINSSNNSALFQVSFDQVAICIGREPSLDMLNETVELNGYHSSSSSLFCVGSLAGDHFVRYLVGGCLHVARLLLFLSWSRED